MGRKWEREKMREGDGEKGGIRNVEF